MRASACGRSLRTGEIVRISGYDEGGPFLAVITGEGWDGSLSFTGFRDGDLPLEATLARDGMGRWWLCEEPLRYRPYAQRKYSLLPYRGGIIVRRRCALEPLHVRVRRATEAERARFLLMEREWKKEA